MWRLVLTVVLWNTISSQPVTENTEHTRQSRQIDFVKCCPCPGTRSFEDFIKRHGADAIGAASDQDFRASSGDCPCRFRSADAEGAASILFPNAVRPPGPVMRSDGTKDDLKPLLHPEVGLASSMLETLRAVTDEEYQEALARDAARNEARGSELRDSLPEKAKNILTIIVNPNEGTNEDAKPEASSAQETRCAAPLASKLGFARKYVADPFTPQDLQINSWDMDTGASNVQEQKASLLNTGLEGLKLRASPSVLNFFSTKKPDREHVQSLLKLKNNNNNLAPVPSNNEQTKLGTSVPTLKLSSLLNKEGQAVSLRPLASTLSKFDVLNLKKTTPADTKSDATGSASSISQEQFLMPRSSDSSKVRLKTFLKSQNSPKTPLSLTNLLNLKDVELIPPKPNKPFTLPGLNLPPLRINTPHSLKRNSKTRSKATKKCDSDHNIGTNTKNVDEINIKTKILDTLPKPSEINVVFNNFNDNTTKPTKIKPNKLNKSEIRILDAMPSPSENIDTVVSFTDSIDDDTEGVTKPSIKKLNKTRIIDVLPSTSENTAIIVSSIDSNDDDTEKVPQISKTAKTKILDTLPGSSENSDYEAVNNEKSHGEEESNNVFNEFAEYVESDEDEINFNNELSKDDSSTSQLSNDNESISFIISGNENPEIDFVDITDNISEINIDEYSSDEKERDIIFEIESSDPVIESDNSERINPFSLAESKIQTEILANNQKQEDNINEDNLFKESLSQFEDNIVSLARTNNDQLVSPSSNEYLEVKERSIENGSIDYEEPSKNGSNTLTMLGKDDITSSVKQRLAINLQTLKNSNSKVLTVSRFSRPELEQSRFGVLSSDSSESNVDTFIAANTANHPDFEKTTNTGSNEVNNDDLRHNHRLNNNIEHRTPSSKVSDPIFNNSDMETVPTMHIDTIESFGEEDSNRTLENNGEMSDIDMEGSRKTGESFSNNVDVESCPSGFDNVKSKEVATISGIGASTNEMEAGASESIFNTLPTAPSWKSLSSSNLRQSILEPSSLFDGNNVFNPIPALPHLPTLEDIREDISKLLGEDERDAKENFSDNFEDAEDCLDNESTMATGASTSNSKLSLPSLKSLDSVNLDIFQIKPLGQGNPLMPTIPSLNLNSFNTKMALPKSLDLKPIKLQSAFSGKKGDLFGASLTIGPKKGGISRNSTPLSNLESIMSNQGLSKLGNPLQDLPNLSEISSAMRDNAKSLFNSPIVQQIQNPIEDTLRTSHSLGNSLRSHTENTVRNLQESLASTLNEASVTNLNKGGGKFAKPEDLLEHLASAREDMNDKLHAIQIDFKDRLETLHDHITEQTNLPMLNSPLLDTFARIENSPLGSSLHQSTMPSWMQSIPKSSTKKTNSRKESTKPRKSTSKTKITQSHSKIAKGQPTLKPFRMSKAASSLTPKKVEVPKLTTTSAKPPFSKPLIRDDKVKLKETAPLFAGNQNTRFKSPRKQFKPFGDFKVTFEPAPTPTTFHSKSQTERKSSGLQSSGPLKYDDASVLASEPKVSLVSPPKQGFTPKPLIPKLEGIPRVREPVSEKPKIANKNPLTSRAPATLRPILKLTTPLPLPKVTESPLLARMRDSIRIKLSERTRNPTDKLKKTDGANDMARAASENTGVVLKTEPMKENVSYKCKMVCVRE